MSHPRCKACHGPRVARTLDEHGYCGQGCSQAFEAGHATVTAERDAAVAALRDVIEAYDDTVHDERPLAAAIERGRPLCKWIDSLATLLAERRAGERARADAAEKGTAFWKKRAEMLEAAMNLHTSTCHQTDVKMPQPVQDVLDALSEAEGGEWYIAESSWGRK